MRQGQAIRPTEQGRAKIREMHWMMCEMVKVFAAECENDFDRTWNAIADFAKLHQNTKAATLFELVWVDYQNAIGVCESGPSGGDGQAAPADGQGAGAVVQEDGGAGEGGAGAGSECIGQCVCGELGEQAPVTTI